MTRIADLVEAELIEFLSTDLTISEVAKKHTENDYEVIRDVGRLHFRKLVTEHVGITLPEMSKAELRASISKKFTEQVAAMFKVLKAKTLAIDDVKPSTVFAAYSEGNGFFSVEGKKDQFPDAFIFECLKAEASAESPVIIVSDDGDFDVPIESEEHISLLKTIPELFQKLGLQVEAPEIEKFFHENEDFLMSLVEVELGDETLFASDGEDVFIEVDEVISVEPVNLISFGSLEKGGDILIVGTVKINSLIKYTHPDCDTETFDSELKRIIPDDEVAGYGEVTFEADFSMLIFTNASGQPAQIKEFRFKNNLFIIELNDPHVDYQ